MLTHHIELGIDVITPEECAKGTLKDLGEYYQTFGHIKHFFVSLQVTILPRFIYDSLIGYFMHDNYKKRQELIKKGKLKNWDKILKLILI